VARYSDESKERVRAAVDFAEVVGARTELRRAGVNRLTGLCPFHDERTPSFGIDPVQKVFHCFGCGEGGDVFAFVMKTESLDFPSALEVLAERAGIELEREEEDPRDAQRRERQSRLYALLERTAAYYVRMLWESDEAADARAYLSDRGLEEGVLRQFRVGYAPSAWDRVLIGSQRAGFSVGELQASGLAQRNDRGQHYDRFRARLMFPLADLRGRVIGFGARALRENQQPKYLNSSEGEVYSKGRHVYAADIARAAAAKEGAVVLCEGYTDVIALHQAGVRGAVGSMGTALTDRQAGELASLAPSVVLCLDADKAGWEAMLRAEAALRAAASSHSRALDVRVAALPAGSDPADLVLTAGADAAKALIAGAIPFAKFRVERALASGDLGSPEGRERMLGEVAGVIRPLSVGLVRDDLVQLVADRLGMTSTLIAARLSEIAVARPVRPAPPRVVAGTGGAGAAFGDDDGPSAADEAARFGHSAPAALTHREQVERGFLALCLAFPDAGAVRLADESTTTLLAAPQHRRAADHLREHLTEPLAGLPSDDDAFARLMAEIVVRAAGASEAEKSELDRTILHLELEVLNERIGAAKQEGAGVLELSLERQSLLAKMRHLNR